MRAGELDRLAAILAEVETQGRLFLDTLDPGRAERMLVLLVLAEAILKEYVCNVTF